MLPREKLIKYGPSSLTDEELLAVLLGTGRSGENVLDFSRRLLRMFDLKKLFRTDMETLLMVDGIGLAKAARILAAMELGRRIFGIDGRIINTLEDIYDAVRDYARSRQEQLIILLMDGSNTLISMEVVARGSRNMVYVSLRDIAEVIIRSEASRVAFAHNHPSGNLTPSREDIRLTSRLVRFLKEMEVDFVAHIVFSDRGFVEVKPGP